MRRLVPLLALAGLLMAPGPRRKPGPNDGQNQNITTRIFPAGGGIGTLSDLCGAFSSELTGTWLCLRGDGTVATGSQALTPIAAPATEVKAFCPNGPNCGNVTTQRTNGTTQSFDGAALASPAGDFSVVWVGTINNTSLGTDQVLVAKDEIPTAGARGFAMDSTSTGNIRAYLFGGDASVTTVTGTAVGINAALHIFVATYDSITDGTSVLKLYVDGTEVATDSTADSPMQNNSTIPWTVGRRVQTGSEKWLAGTTINAMMTEKVLSPATVTAMTSASIGSIAGSYGQALTYARASAATCDNSAGDTMSVLPTNRPCVRSGGALIEAAATNLILRGRTMTNSSWTKTSSTAATTSTGIDGKPNSATVLTATGSNGRMTQQVQTGGGQYTGSFYLKRTTGSGNVQLTDDLGVTWTTVSPAPSSTAWTRYSLTQTLTALAIPGGINTLGGLNGNLDDGTYCYRIAATNSLGVTTASAEVCVAVTMCLSLCDVTISWNAVSGATGYRIYGRTTGAEQLLASQASTTYFDDGLSTPAGSIPSRNSTADHSIGVRLVTSGNVVQVDFAQLETGGFATSAVETVASSVTRAKATFSAAATGIDTFESEGCYKFCFTPEWTGSTPSTIHFVSPGASDALRVYINSGNGDAIQAFDGDASTPSVTADYVAGVKKCYRLTWSTGANQFRITNVTSGATDVSTYVAPVLNGTLFLGGNSSATANAYGLLSDFVLGKSREACP